MTLVNRVKEEKRFTRNMTIKEMAVEYAKERKVCETLAPVNQVRIRKRIMLPYELVGFKGDKKTKEARCDDDKSCVTWKIKFEKLPKVLNKSHKLWNKFVDWLASKKHETIVDFNNEIDIMCKITRDKKFIKRKISDEEVVHKAHNIRQCQLTHQRTED